jgi:hypothetical protein
VEQNAGMVIALDKGKFDAGFIFNLTRFSIDVRRAPTPYNQFAFHGAQNISTGVFGSYRLRNISFFGEAAREAGAGSGTVLGFLASLHAKFELAMVYRNYSRDFHSFYGNALSENTQLQNEQGVYWGWRYRRDRRFNLGGYIDVFRFPWLGFRRYSPASGYEWMLRAKFQPVAAKSLSLSWKEESKARNTPGTTGLYELGECLRRSLSFLCDFPVGEKIRLRSRVQYSQQEVPGAVTEGWSFAQDLSVSLRKVRLTARHALFDTDHYDNRHYLYENDAWSSYSLPAYAGVGVRNYALIEYKVTRQLTIWVRYARTLMSTDGQIGTGQDLIEGNKKNDVKFQARIKF